MRSLIAGMLLLTLSRSAAHAGTPAASPHAWTDQVDPLLAEYDRSDSPGCALGIFRDGRIAYARGYGMANLELGVANSPHTVCDIGSLGKQLTAFSILLLAREGKLSLDDDIRRFLPEIPDYGKLFEDRPSGGRPSLTASGEGEERRRFEPIEVWSPSPAKLRDFAGLYAGDEVPALFRFAVVDGSLVLRHRVLPGGPWRATLQDSFAHGGQSVSFTRDAAGRVDGFRLASGGMTGLLFRRIGL